MTQHNLWALIAAFSNADERDKCLTETKAALARSTDGSSAQTYRTEMTDGTPGLGIEHPDRETLAPLLSSIASAYRIVSISMYQGS